MGSIFLSFLSGAIGGALITALFNYFSEKHNRKINYLKNQIDNFYGPLNFILTSSEKLLETSKEIIDAGGVVYAASEIEKTKAREARDQNEMLYSFEVSNTYDDEAVKNNEKISGIISSNYSYIDLDDIDIVDQFIKNYSRLKIEYQGQRRLPLKVNRIVGSISTLQTDFKNKIKEKFKLKKLELTEPSFFNVLFLKIKNTICTSICKWKK